MLSPRYQRRIPRMRAWVRALPLHPSPCFRSQASCLRSPTLPLLPPACLCKHRRSALLPAAPHGLAAMPLHRLARLPRQPPSVILQRSGRLPSSQPPQPPLRRSACRRRRLSVHLPRCQRSRSPLWPPSPTSLRNPPLTLPPPAAGLSCAVQHSTTLGNSRTSSRRRCWMLPPSLSQRLPTIRPRRMQRVTRLWRSLLGRSPLLRQLQRSLHARTAGRSR